MPTCEVRIEIDVPEGVTICGHERCQGAHVLEIDFDLPAEATCSHCKRTAPTNVRYKSDVLAIRDLDLLGEPCFWVYRPPLHQCPACRQRTQLPTPFKRPNVTYTLRFEQWVMEQLPGATVEDLARRLSVSAEMIEQIVRRQLDERQAIPPDRVITSIGMDELSLKKRHKLYVTVMSDLSDPAHPQVLAVVEGRNRAAVEACLAKLAPRQRATVRSHRTDMSSVYADVCSELLPNSQSVIDRFHVAKRLGELVDSQRKKLANSS